MANRRKKKKNRWMAALRDVLLALLLIGVVVSVIALIYGKLFGWNETQIAPNRYRTEAFYREDGFLHYQDAPYMIGIDVSAHQGQIDWERVRDAGVEFAILRAGFRGYAEGTLSEDDYFRENYEGARRVGLKIGVYFFSQARSEAEAMEEAQFVCSLLAGCTLDLPVYFDWETVDKSDRITGSAAAYTYLGTANYVKHDGEKPMNITWKLDHPIPAKYLKKTNKLVVG